MMAMLLDAELHVAWASGTRTVAARDFFRDALSVSLGEEEIVTEIVLPKLPPRHRLGVRGDRAPQRRLRARGGSGDADLV